MDRESLLSFTHTVTASMINVSFLPPTSQFKEQAKAGGTREFLT